MAVELLDEIGSDLVDPSEQTSHCNALENVPDSSFYHLSFSHANNAMTQSRSDLMLGLSTYFDAAAILVVVASGYALFSFANGC